MKKTIFHISLIAALSGLTFAAGAQTNVWHDDFDQQTVGANSASTNNPYGAVAFNYTSAGYGNPMIIITNDDPDTLNGYTGTNCAAFVFDTDTNDFSGSPLNFGLETAFIPVLGGNTNTSLRAYTLNFDIALQAPTNITDIGGFIGPSYGLYGPGSGEYYGNGCQTNPPLSIFPTAGTGYQHISVPLASFGTANAGLLVPTNSSFAFFMAFYIAGYNYPGNVRIDIANISITMSNPPPLPPPVVTVLPAKPGLRVFAQNDKATYNQEGFSTVDTSQSWVGYANPYFPPSYSITIGDFDTVDNYSLYVQFLPNGSPGDPYGVYNGPNALVWTITHQGTGFTTGISWKTNAPQSGTPNIALPTTTTASTDGRGTWTLTFTNDLGGWVTEPDGTTTNFSLPDETVASKFANPLIVDFGIAPNNTAGYGQYIDIIDIVITNVLDTVEVDNFTQDSVLNPNLWNPGFSVDAGSVILVSTNTPYWVNWTVPDTGFGLETKASLSGGTNVWFSPAYYGSSASVANTTPTQMGQLLKWTLIPAGCLPTVDGTPGGTPSTTGFFRLSNPPPSQ